jgi:integrase
MQEKGSSENHQVNNLKVVIDFAKFLGPTMLYEVENREQVISFLNRKIKSLEDDPEKRWITTWNHYLNRIKLFERWLFNYYLRHKQNIQENEEWITPDFCKIKPKRTKRLSPYSESEIWERDELLTLIKYEPHLRNKAILSLMWDLNARPHELTLLRIKNIRLKEAYGEGEIPHQAKTGSGPILLMMSFCYVRDWINQHPFKNEPNARLICNLHNGAPIKAKSVWNMMRQLRNRIMRLIETKEISDESERQQLVYLLTTKKWNPYSFRHSSITADSDYLPEYALKKKVRWVMNSRQGNRYIKSRMGNDLKQKILTYNGIAAPDEMKKKPSVFTCPRCELINAIDNKYCSKCSYPLVPSAFEEIKMAEKNHIKELKSKYDSDIEYLKSAVRDLQNSAKY